MWEATTLPPENPSVDLMTGAERLRAIQHWAKGIASDAIDLGLSDVLRDLADILERREPKGTSMPLTPAQSNIVLTLHCFVEEHGEFPASRKQLIDYAARREDVDPISKSVISDFPVPLPIGKGTSGRRPGN